MKYVNLENGVVVFSKETGLIYEISDFNEETATLTEVVPEEEKEDRIPQTITMTPENAEFFRFVENPNPYKIPTANIQNEKLFVNGTAIQMGKIKPLSIAAVLPGKVIFTIENMSNDNLLDLKGYMPREDRFIDVMQGVSTNATYHVENDTLIIVDNQSRFVDRKDDEGKPVLDDGNTPIVDEIFEKAIVALYKDTPLTLSISKSNADDTYDNDNDDVDDEYYDYYDECADNNIRYFNAPVEFEKFSDFAGRQTVILTSNRIVKNGIIENRDGDLEIILVPVSLDHNSTRTPNTYIVSGNAAVITPSLSEGGSISFTIHTDQSITYTNAGHRKRVIEDEIIAKELDGYDIFLGIRFARGGSETTLSYGNSAGEIKRVLIKTTSDRGDIYTVTTD